MVKLKSSCLTAFGLLAYCTIASSNLFKHQSNSYHYSNDNNNNVAVTNGQGRQPIQQNNGYATKPGTVVSGKNNEKQAVSEDQKLSSFKLQMLQVKKQLGIEDKIPEFGGPKHSAEHQKSLISVKTPGQPMRTAQYSKVSQSTQPLLREPTQSSYNVAVTEQQGPQRTQNNYNYASNFNGMNSIHGQKEMDENTGNSNMGNNPPVTYESTNNYAESNPNVPISDAFGSAHEPETIQQTNNVNIQPNVFEIPTTNDASYQEKDILEQKESSENIAIYKQNDAQPLQVNDLSLNQSPPAMNVMSSMPAQEPQNQQLNSSPTPMTSNLAEPQNSDPKLEEGQPCGCDMTMNCLGTCKEGLECKYEDVTVGNGICTKIKEVATNDAEAALDAMKMLKDVASSAIEDQVSSDASANGENTGVNPSGEASMNETPTNDVDNKAKDSNDATAKEGMNKNNTQGQAVDAGNSKEVDENLKLISGFHGCNCRYFPSLFSDFVGAFSGGCIIDGAAPSAKGYQCHCSMPFFFTCHGTPIACKPDAKEQCLGGDGEESCDPSGNCEGYNKKMEFLTDPDTKLFERIETFEDEA